jgi:hypothetical protein
MALDSLTKRITLIKVYELFPKLSGVVTATAEQSLHGLDIALEQDPDGVSDQEAVSIVASLRVSAVRLEVGAFIYISLDDELAFWCGSPLRMHLGTRTGNDKNLCYVARSLIDQLKALGISATWDADNNSVMIAS